MPSSWTNGKAERLFAAAVSFLTGALGILGDAYHQGLIDDPLGILTEMRQHGFRTSDELAARFRVLVSARYAR